MSEQQSIAEWARTADFGEPLRWGSVESAALARATEAELELPGPEIFAQARRLERVSTILMSLWRAVQILAPVIGILTVLLALRSTEEEAFGGWLVATDLAFIVSIATLFTTLTTSGKTRLTWAVVSAAWAAVASATAFLLSSVVWLGLTHILILGAAVLAIVVVIILLVRRRPAKRHRRERPGDLTPEQFARKGVRAKVLEVLVKRGLVKEDDIDIPMMVEMPLGSWHELDTPST